MARLKDAVCFSHEAAYKIEDLSNQVTKKPKGNRFVSHTIT